MPNYRKARQAGTCEPLPVLREERPTEACLAQYVTFTSENHPQSRWRAVQSENRTKPLTR